MDQDSIKLADTLCLADYKRRIFLDNFGIFVNILKDYRYAGLTPQEVVANIAKSEETRGDLHKLLDIYFSAEMFDRLREDYPTITPPVFKPNYKVDNSSIERSIKGIAGKVLVKPNLVSKEDYPETSSLDTLESLIDSLSSNGNEVVIGDGPSLFFHSEYAIDKVKNRFPRLKVIDFNESKYHRVKNQDWEILRYIEVPTELYSFDCLVNLTNFKQHNSFMFSGAKKAIMGLISPATRLWMHRLSEDKRVKALNELSDIFQPRINIVDARKILLGAQQKACGGYEKDGPGILISDNASRLDSDIQRATGFYPT